MSDHAKQSLPEPDDDTSFVHDDSETSADDKNADYDFVRRSQANEEHLDNRHIRVVSLERRAIYRNRTWVIVASLVLLGGAGQSVWLAYVAARTADWRHAAAYFTLAFGMAVFGFWFGRKIKPLTAEADAMKLPDPQTLPDFSSLSNGGHFADALEQMATERNEQQMDADEKMSHRVTEDTEREENSD